MDTDIVPDIGVHGGKEHEKEAEMWKKVRPKNVDYEDAMGRKKIERVWEVVYKAVGMASGSEEDRKSVRLGVYVYGCLNGASRESDYSAEITTSGGLTFSASVVAMAVGEGNLRRFFRGNMDESYTALKLSGVMEEYPRFVAKAASLGIGVDVAFAMADWMKDCSKLTPAEVKAHDMATAYSLERARRARSGKTLEKIERQRIEQTLESQGSLVEPAESVKMTSW